MVEEKQYRIAVVDSSGMVTNVIIANSDFTLPGAMSMVKVCEVDHDGFDLEPIISSGKPKPGIGWMHDGSDFIHPNDMIKSKDELKSFLAAERFAAETNGIAWEGSIVKTDRKEQQFFSEIRMRAAQFPDELITYKVGEGSFKKQTLKQFLPLAEAVYAYVQKCFNAEASVCEKIDADQVTTINQLLKEFTDAMGIVLPTKKETP